MAKSYVNVSPASAISVLRLWTDPPNTQYGSGARPEFTFPDSELGHGADLTVSAAGYAEVKLRVSLTQPQFTDEQGQIVGSITLQPVHVEHVLTCDNNNFYLDGAIYKIRGLTAFPWFGMTVKGQNIDALIAEAHELRFKTPRILLQWYYSPGLSLQFSPQNYTLADFDTFAQRMAGEGFIPEYEVYADNQVFNTPKAWFYQVCDVLKKYPCIPSLGNELDKNFESGTTPGDFTEPDHPCVSRGSLMSEQVYRPAWKVIAYHGRRDYPKVFLSSSDPMIFLVTGEEAGQGHIYPKKVTIHDECIKFGTQSTDQQLAYTLGADSVIVGDGGVFHYQSGLEGKLMTGTERACAVEYIRGVENNT